jgi:methenyltetrahydromethanopterin cyclohydrolase
MTKALVLNEHVKYYFAELVNNAALLNIKAIKHELGPTIVDCGINFQGGFSAGEYLTLICMGGLADTSIDLVSYSTIQLPTITVSSNNPVLSTLGSQYAGWSISKKGYFAMGSGPARILSRKPKELYEQLSLKENSSFAYIVLETDSLPPEFILEYIAEKCKIKLENLFVLVAPTASISGSTQISGRAIETAIHKLHKNGMAISSIISASGSAPIAPVFQGKNEIMMGRTNDMLIYGSDVYLTVKLEDDGKLEHHVNEAVSMNSVAYGSLFIEEVKKANGDFYKIDPNIFAPARLTIGNTKTGTTYTAGTINTKMIAQSIQSK